MQSDMSVIGGNERGKKPGNAQGRKAAARLENGRLAVVTRLRMHGRCNGAARRGCEGDDGQRAIELAAVTPGTKKTVAACGNRPARVQQNQERKNSLATSAQS